MEPTEPTDDAPTPQEPRLCDLLRGHAADCRKVRLFGNTKQEVARIYDYAADLAEPFEQRRLAAEEEAATLRARLETTETALRAIVEVPKGTILQMSLGHMIHKMTVIAQAALTTEARQPAPGGDGEAGEGGGTS